MNSMKGIFLVLGIILVSFFYVSIVMAAEFEVAEKGGNVTIDEEIKNLYTAGNIVSINADIEKSLHAAGNVVTISGDVENNIYVVGGTVVIKGDIGGSVHAGAGNILIEGEIEDDLFLGGGTITLSESSSIGGDLIVAAGVAEVNGPVDGDIHLSGGEVFIDSKIGGEVNIKAGEELRLGSKAEIVGDLKYSSVKEVVMDEGAKILGETTYKKIKVENGGLLKKPKKFMGILTLGFLIKLLITITAGLVLVYLLRNITEKVIKESLGYFWANLGRGFGALILIPIACIILAVTVIGLWLAGLISVTYILMILLSSVLASIVFGSWLIKVLGKKSEYPINWKAVVVGVIVLNIVVLIPFIGWFVKFVFVLISLGAVFQLVRKNIVLTKQDS